MKRYLIFSGLDYDACGGWGDFQEDADDLLQARERVQMYIASFGVNSITNESRGWAHIVDTESMEEID